MISCGYNTHMMDLSACTTIFDIYEMEAFPLDRRGLSLLRYFVSFCIGKAFVSSSFDNYSEACSSEKNQSLSKPCRVNEPTEPSLDSEDEADLIMSEASHKKFARFHVIQTVPYSCVNGQNIDLSILIPNKLRGRRDCPLIVRFHGGYLTTGSRLYPDWFQDWILEYAFQKGAIIVAPDYRLLPEASGADIIEDIGSFWVFVSEWLNEVLHYKGGWSANTRDTLVIGDSAGSHLAAISALQFCKFQKVHIKAMISGFGMVDMEHEHFTEDAFKGLPDINEPLPHTFIDDAIELANKKEEETGVRPYRTSVTPPNRVRIGHALLQRGRYGEFMAGNAASNNIDTIRNLGLNAPLPGFWLYHGLRDRIVPHTVSEGFVRALKRELVKRHDEEEHYKILYTIREDGEHGLDKGATPDDDWMREGLAHIEQYWGH